MYCVCLCVCAVCVCVCVVCVCVCVCVYVCVLVWLGLQKSIMLEQITLSYIFAENASSECINSFLQKKLIYFYFSGKHFVMLVHIVIKLW